MGPKSFYLAFFLTIYLTTLPLLFLYAILFLEKSFEIKPPLFVGLLIGSGYHTLIAMQAADDLIQKLASNSTNISLLGCGILAGLSDILGSFVLLVICTLFINTVGLQGNLVIVLLLFGGCFFLPPMFIPLVVVYYFCSNSPKNS